MTPKTYYELAEELAVSAPAQGRLLRYLLLQEEMQDIGAITSDLGVSVANFRLLVVKLRDRGVEVICQRTHDPEDINLNVRYVYGVNTSRVENWSGERRQAVMTAWKRTTKVFERHLFALDLDHSDIYKILGVMEFVTKALEDIDLDVSIKAEAAAAARATEEVAEIPALSE